MVEYSTVHQYEKFGENKFFHVIGEGRNPVKVVEEGILAHETKEREGQKEEAAEKALSILETMRPEWYDTKHENHVFLWPDAGDAIEQSMKGAELTLPIAVVDMDKVPCQCYMADSQLSAVVFNNAKKEVLGMEDNIVLESRDAASKYWDSVKKVNYNDLEGLRAQEVEIMCPCDVPGEATDRIITGIEFEI